MFTSDHPINIGHAPRTKVGVRPALCECGRVAIRIEHHWGERPAWNVILYMLRDAVNDRSSWDDSEDGDGPWEFRYQRWLQYTVNGDIEPDSGYPTKAEFKHAEKVLRRLIALQGQEAWV